MKFSLDFFINQKWIGYKPRNSPSSFGIDIYGGMISPLNRNLRIFQAGHTFGTGTVGALPLPYGIFVLINIKFGLLVGLRAIGCIAMHPMLENKQN
jgi:hypothetical protein